MGPVVTEGSTVTVMLSSPYAGITRSGSYGRRPQAVLSAHSACAPASYGWSARDVTPTEDRMACPTALSSQVLAQRIPEVERCTCATKQASRGGAHRGHRAPRCTGRA